MAFQHILEMADESLRNLTIPTKMQLGLLFPDKSFMTETKYYPSEVTISIKIASDHRITNTNILLNISTVYCKIYFPFPFCKSH